MTAWLRLAVHVASALRLTSCTALDSSPVYTVDANYQSPSSPDGRQQALQCEQIKYACLQLNETRMQQCMPPAEQTYYACLNDPMTAPFQCEDRLAAARSACDGTSACASGFDACFQRAGGTIQRTSRCVRNCGDRY